MKLLSFAPDLETTEPGVILDGINFVSVPRGIKAMPTMQDADIPSLGENIAHAYIRYNDQSREIVVQKNAGGQVVWDGINWTDITGTNNNEAGFIEFGSVMLSYGFLGFHERTTGAFTAVADSPYCNFAFATDNGFVIAANGGMSGQVAGDNAWFASNIFDYQTWTPATNNVASNGQLYFPAGQITGGASLGQNAVLYKRNAIYLGSYLGPREKWAWPAVSTSIGCVDGGSLVEAGDAHYFLGEDDFYVFDGTRPRAISSPIRLWLVENLFSRSWTQLSGAYDQLRKCIVWTWKDFFGGFYGVTYSLTTGLWGRVGYVERFVKQASTLPRLIDNNLLSGLGFVPSLIGFDSAGRIRYTNEEYNESWVQTGDFGGEEDDFDVTRIRVRFVSKPSLITGIHYVRDVYSDPFDNEEEAIYFNEDRLEANQQAKFHRFRVDMTGDWEMAMFNVAAPKNRR